MTTKRWKFQKIVFRPYKEAIRQAHAGQTQISFFRKIFPLFPSSQNKKLTIHRIHNKKRLLFLLKFWHQSCERAGPNVVFRTSGRDRGVGRTKFLEFCFISNLRRLPGVFCVTLSLILLMKNDGFSSVLGRQSHSFVGNWPFSLTDLAL